jgi:hypothetical protein
MRFALIPENNPLSHILKCLVVQKALVEHGAKIFRVMFYKIPKKNKYENIRDCQHKLGCTIEEPEATIFFLQSTSLMLLIYLALFSWYAWFVFRYYF